jgi:predicted Zn finger-like uncharacterized protein
MIITCPRCATRYLLETGVVRPPGRQVRCARCQHAWFQDAAPEMAPQPIPIPVPVEDPLGPAMPSGPVTDRSRMLPAPSSSGTLAEPLPRFDIPPPPPPRPMPTGMPPPPQAAATATRRQHARSRSMLLMMAGGATFVGALLLFFTLPNEIARIWPGAASIYGALGMDVNVVGFKIIATQKNELNNSVPVIAISGQIINETDRELDVPKVRLAVRDQAGKEIYHWTVLADQSRLGPRQQGTFSARLESPPSDAVDLEVRFAKVDE